ncbi:MAG: hypothetical protein SFV32_00210 [Opitutaceae bacterium]|nr:hypothetical protein [Opitutaceae bacterium]
MEKEKLSRVPSWIMLGFIAGGLAVYTLVPELKGFWHKRRAQADAAAAAAVSAERPSPTPAPTPAPKPAPTGATLEEVDMIFTIYRADAVWDNDRTEIAIWNRYKERFSDFYELYRDGDGKIWYRPILELTRPVIQYEGEEGRPIRFTESQWSRDRRMEQIPLLLRPAAPKL